MYFCPAIHLLEISKESAQFFRLGKYHKSVNAAFQKAAAAGPTEQAVIKAIALAQSYVADEGITIKFAVQFRDLEDPELRNVPSTFLHFAIIYSS